MYSLEKSLKSERVAHKVHGPLLKSIVPVFSFDVVLVMVINML